MLIRIESNRIKDGMLINDKIIRGHDSVMFQVFQKMAGDIVDLAKENLETNGNVDTGELLRDIGIKEIDEKTKEILVGTELMRGVHIEFGRGPVFPVTAKVLHWKDKDGKDVFSMFSKETQPSPFFEPAVIDITQKFSDVYADDVGVWFNSLGIRT